MATRAEARAAIFEYIEGFYKPRRRLEHIVPWAIQDSRWGAGGLTEAAGTEKPPSRCSHCVAQLGEAYVLLVRHRGGHRIVDGFCSVTDMRDWGKRPVADSARASLS